MGKVSFRLWDRLPCSSPEVRSEALPDGILGFPAASFTGFESLQPFPLERASPITYMRVLTSFL